MDAALRHLPPRFAGPRVRRTLALPALVWADHVESSTERAFLYQLVSRVLPAVCFAALDTALYRALRLRKEGVDVQHTPSMPDARVHASG